jgi:hypothetical protein
VVPSRIEWQLHGCLSKGIEGTRLPITADAEIKINMWKWQQQQQQQQLDNGRSTMERRYKLLLISHLEQSSLGVCVC